MILHKETIDNCIKKIAANLLFFCFSITAFSQDEKSALLVKKFTDYQQHNFQEKIFVHTDKTFYLAGETIWFKVYDVDAYFNMPSTISNICYIEITDNYRKPVLQTKIDIHYGNGNGSFSIPSSVASGNFQLRAYTNWMKNFSADFYFHQQITIVNTLKKFSPANEEKKDSGTVIQFFPEGGNLVYGLTSKIAFKAVDKNGDAINCKGIIADEANQAVMTFQSLRFGMGSFVLTPQAGHQYHAVLKINDTDVLQDLPSIYNQGYVIRLADSDAHTIKISVQSNYNHSSSLLYLFVQTHNLVKSVQSNSVKNGQAIFFVDREALGDGISQFTVFNQDRQPVCERLYFKRPAKKMLVESKTDQAIYTTRKKVTIDLLTTDQAGRPVSGNMSMSVFQLDSLQPLQYISIVNYLMLTSDLKGEVESPEYYFDDTSPEVDEAANNLMLTQGWRRFKWEDVLQDKKNYFEFLPETEGPVVAGTITDKKTGLPAKDITAYLSLPGEIFTLRSTASDNGVIRFNTGNFYGKREMIVQTNSTTDSSYRIDIAGDYSDKFPAYQLSKFELFDKWKNQLIYRNINVQADNSYLTDKKRRYYALQSDDTTQFYGTPDKKYFLDEYTRFLTMEELIHEFVSDVRVRKESGKFEVRIWNDISHAFFEDDPLIMLDGVPVFDMDKVMAFDPLKIKKIEVVSRKFYAGSLVNDGILSLQTYNSDLGGYQVDPNALVIEYDGLQRKREFYSPVYETASQVSSRLPDVRNTLLWLPEIKINSAEKKQLTFYTSDLTGKFAVIIQGLTASGLAGSSVLTFDVK